MKRTTEFTLGLIGGILGTITALFTFIFAGCLPVTDSLAGIAFLSNGTGIIFGIIIIVFSCLVNKKSKLSGICLIVFSTLLFLTNFFQIIPFGLALSAGIVCLKRKTDKE